MRTRLKIFIRNNYDSKQRGGTANAFHSHPGKMFTNISIPLPALSTPVPLRTAIRIHPRAYPPKLLNHQCNLAQLKLLLSPPPATLPATITLSV